MQTTIEQALFGYNSRLVNEILGNPDFVEATASGRFADFINSAESVEIEKTATGYRFVKYGTDYTTALDKGTTPGGREGLERDIYEWLQYKKYGLEWDTEQERQALAIRLTDKIEGWGSFKYRTPLMQTTIIADALRNAEPLLFELLNSAHVAQTQIIVDSLTGEIK